MILVLTLFRLALNVSATRLVLLDGYAGKVIDTFGHFVVGGSLIVGLIVFAILLVIQFVVITNGAGRVAEVGARFTLDAMPGKQMAIDADLNSGLIDEDEARRRRAEVHAEADFYGAMDGASKFVKGDAIAAIIITLVNLIGGFAVGVAQHGMSFGEAITTYSLLSVGDGLVSQIPALLLSVATGLIVTRSVGDEDMGSDILRQLTGNQMPLRIAGFAALALCLIPGLPKIPFLLAGGAMLLASTRVRRRTRPDEAADDRGAPRWPRRADTPELLAAEIQVDPLGLELSADLIDLVDTDQRRRPARPGQGAAPQGRHRPRHRGAAGAHPRQPRAARRTYAIMLFGVEVARGEAPPGTVLAIGDFLGSLPGEPTQEPVFGLEAKWIPAELRSQAELSGATVVDRASVITTHLAEVVTQHAARLLGREDVRMLTDVVKRTPPGRRSRSSRPTQLSLGEVQRVLQALLDEGVSIRDLVRIFEALSLRAARTKELDALVEAARHALGPAIVGAVPRRQGAARDHPRAAARAADARVAAPLRAGPVLALDPDTSQALLTNLAQLVTEVENRNLRPVLVCAPQLRAAVRRLVHPIVPRLAVLSYQELGGAEQIRSEGIVGAEQRLASVGA